MQEWASRNSQQILRLGVFFIYFRLGLLACCIIGLDRLGRNNQCRHLHPLWFLLGCENHPPVALEVHRITKILDGRCFDELARDNAHVAVSLDQAQLGNLELLLAFNPIGQGRDAHLIGTDNIARYLQIITRADTGGRGVHQGHVDHLRLGGWGQ